MRCHVLSQHRIVDHHVLLLLRPLLLLLLLVWVRVSWP
jgi:hypothetical protein